MFSNSLLTIILLFTHTNAEMQYLKRNISQNEKIRQSLSKCIIQACRRYFNSSFETITYSLPLAKVSRNTISATVLSQLVLPALQNEQRWSILVKNLIVSQPIRQVDTEKSFSYIIQIRREGEFVENVKKLKSFLRWNPHAKFLVVSPTIFADSLKIAANVIKVLWEYNVLNAVVLLVDTSNTMSVNVYSWNPYSHRSCGDNFADIAPVDSCSFGVTQSSVAWFQNKIPKKVYKCPIKVKYMVWPPLVMTVKPIRQVFQYDSELGIDINLLNMIAYTTNTSLIYEKSSFDTWGIIDDHYSATKDLKLLKENKVDLVTGGYSTTPQRIILFDSSRSHHQESLVLCVPHKPIVIEFKIFLNILDTEVWVLVCILYFTFSICIWYVSMCSRNEHRSYKSMSNCLFNNFAVFIGSAVNTPRTIRVRLLFSLLVIFSLKLNMIYTSFLTSVLSSPNYREQYGSMEEIYKHNLQTYFIPNSKMFFEDGDKKEFNNVPLSVIKKRWKNCTNLPECFNSIISRKNVAVCMPRLYKDYLLSNLVGKRREAIFCLKENIVTFPQTILMRKGFPLFSLFDDGIKRIIEAGFIEKWTKDILMNISREKENNDDANGDSENVNIGLSSLVPVILMLLIGYVSSALALIIEIVVHHLNVLG